MRCPARGTQPFVSSVLRFQIVPFRFRFVPICFRFVSNILFLRFNFSVCLLPAVFFFLTFPFPACPYYPRNFIFCSFLPLCPFPLPLPSAFSPLLSIRFLPCSPFVLSCPWIFSTQNVQVTNQMTMTMLSEKPHGARSQGGAHNNYISGHGAWAGSVHKHGPASDQIMVP